MENLKVGQEFKLVTSLIDNGFKYFKIEKGKCYIVLNDYSKVFDMFEICLPESKSLGLTSVDLYTSEVKVLGVLRIKSLK